MQIKCSLSSKILTCWTLNVVNWNRAAQTWSKCGAFCIFIIFTYKWEITKSFLSVYFNVGKIQCHKRSSDYDKNQIFNLTSGTEVGGQWPGIGESVLANQKITIKSIIGSHSANLTVIRMCPPVSSKASTSLLAYKPLLAAGAKSGNILVFNMATGKWAIVIYAMLSPYCYLFLVNSVLEMDI